RDRNVTGVQTCALPIFTVDSPYSYLYTGEYEMVEFNLGHTFNYSEMAALIAPRPFMVERGHNDGVAPDEWVAYEYAKVRRCYDRSEERRVGKEWGCWWG